MSLVKRLLPSPLAGSRTSKCQLKKVRGGSGLEFQGCLWPGLSCFTSPGLISAKLSTLRIKGIPELKRIPSSPSARTVSGNASCLPTADRLRKTLFMPLTLSVNSNPRKKIRCFHNVLLLFGSPE